MARDRDVKSEMYRVLFVILGAATLEGYSTSISQSEIATVLDMAPQNVNCALKRLVTKGIISKRVEGGKLVGYRINEFFGYKQ